MRALEVSPLIDLCFCKMCDLSYRVTLLTFQNCLLQNIASSEVAGVRIKEGFTWFHYGLLGELQMCCRFQTVMEQNRAAHWLLRGRQDLHLTHKGPAISLLTSVTLTQTRHSMGSSYWQTSEGIDVLFMELRNWRNLSSLVKAEDGRVLITFMEMCLLLPSEAIWFDS